MREPHIPLTLDELETNLQAAPPDNESREEGYALVNVLEPEQYERAHIPRSINIPHEEIEEFEEHFDEDKKIVLYCASPDCPVSEEVAQSLSELGFRRVYDFAGGLSTWRQAGYPVEGSEGA